MSTHDPYTTPETDCTNMQYDSLLADSDLSVGIEDWTTDDDTLTF